MTARTASLWLFTRHELRLVCREWIGMITAGRPKRLVTVGAVLLVFAVLMHVVAGGLIRPWLADGLVADKPTLVVVSGTGLLFWFVMLSQAMESVTRAYYTRADLDLILSSPASSRALFAVRSAGIALSTIVLTCLLASPLVDMLVVEDGPKWLAAYGVLAALGALSSTIAIVVTLALFRLLGPGRTRLVSQVIAGLIGAGFVIGIQAGAILSYGHLSRWEFLQSPALTAAAPDPQSWVWLPARAAFGDLRALAIVALVGFGSLAGIIALAASSYGRQAIAAASVSRSTARRRTGSVRFRPTTQQQALRRKEWILLARDPWLLSQTLMQILYLIPPALLLYVNYGNSTGSYVVVVPVLVMASGQLAGGLAWLAVSGEDAHDLVQTAPIPARAVLVAKIQAVGTVIAALLAPFLVALLFAAWPMALVTAICAACAAASSTAIQLWFRIAAKRSMFRRRQTASRVSTISEAFASIMWAGTGALWAAGNLFAIGTAVVVLLVLLVARLLAPKRS